MRHTFLIAVFLALALAAPSWAKGPIDIEICGASRCATSKWSPHDGGANDVAIGILNTDTLDFAAAPAPAPYFQLNAKAEWLEDAMLETRFFWVPAAGALLSGSNWLRVDKQLNAGLREATRGLEPFAPPAVTHAFVNGRRAGDPGAYSALLGNLPPADGLPAPAAYVKVVLRGDRPSPWTSTRRPLEYFPKFNLLHRHVEWLRVPPALAEQIESDAGLAAAAAESRSMWPTYLALAPLALALLGVMVLNRRARRRTRVSADSSAGASPPRGEPI